MTQSGQPGAPPPGGTPPATPPQAPPPPPNWQSAPQPPAPPPAAAPSPMAQQMSALSANLMDRRPVAGPAGFYYADVPNRAIAYIIDAIIVGIVGIVISVIIYAIVGPATVLSISSSGIGSSVNIVPLLIVTLVGLAINAGYFIYTWVYMRGTIGMKALGMQIGNETDGATITMNQAITRWILLGAPFTLAQLLNPWPGLGLLISLAGFVWFIVLLVTTAQSPTKQGIHDRYAKTMVVKAARAVG